MASVGLSLKALGVRPHSATAVESKAEDGFQSVSDHHEVTAQRKGVTATGRVTETPSLHFI